MGGVLRSTAVLRIALPGEKGSEVLALDVQRKYFFDLTINTKTLPGGDFFTPLGDERWRDMIQDLESATQTQGQRHITDNVRDAGRKLHKYLSEISADLSDFLRNTRAQRRLVIESRRPEIHQLPWEAMVDEKWRLLAELDLSLVHSSEGFVLAPESTSGKLRVQAIFGPRTDRKTEAALTTLKTEIEQHRSEKIKVLEPVEGRPGSHEWLEKLEGEIVHIEAHGDPVSGETELPERATNRSGSLDSNELAQGLRNRTMVLLWSCYSAAMHSWGTSLAHSLHRSGNAFVLGFATPLRYESSATLASHFYRTVFIDRCVADPETAIMKERVALYNSDLNSCEWASLTLWLRNPIDTYLAALDGPRLPGDGKEWSDSVKVSDRLSEIFADRVVPGRTVLVLGEYLEGPLPRELVKEYAGPVVHLRGKAALENDSIFQELGVEHTLRQRVHPGDRFLVLLDALGGYSRSLLIWSAIGAREVSLLGFLTRVPDNLAIVLVSGETEITADPTIVVVKTAVPPKQAVKKREPVTDLARMVELVDQDHFVEAATLWKKLRPKMSRWNEDDKISFYSRGYWALVRTGNQKGAEECIDHLRPLNQFEALLIEGNLLDRKGRYREALDRYERAQKQANNNNNTRDQGRSIVEQAYVTYELGDFPMAEILHTRSIQLLETVPADARDTNWGSALGRALRDSADALSRDPSRSQQADALLRRAMAIHAIDGRLNQVAAVLQTRGKLASNSDNLLLAEEFLQRAAVLLRAQNRNGWAYTAWWLAKLASRRGNLEQALAILSSSFQQLYGDNDYPLDKGRIAREMARVYWTKGDLAQTTKWATTALSLFPKERRQERREAAALASFCESLIEEPQQPEIRNKSKRK